MITRDDVDKVLTAAAAVVRTRAEMQASGQGVSVGPRARLANWFRTQSAQSDFLATVTDQDFAAKVAEMVGDG